VHALAGLPDFYMLRGEEHFLAEAVIGGASGFVVSLLHIDPRPFVAVFRVARAGDYGCASAMQEKVTDVMNLIVASFERRPEIHLCSID
jgi:dihydrodipicolinate synthase/N-acetylneuraminate lyase